MKRLIRLFGFTAHDAPGEAEAECALLQQKGVVDAVLSEDVDTIMFGCGKTMRSWSAESKSGQTPTHVTVYDAERLRQGEKRLDREGMVLVALMSGGDYIPEGIPNCGVKLACEAARAGFGTSLCRIKKSDQAAIEQWKADLSHELRTNDKGFFRTKHKALTIPDSFPNMEVLRYYTHPVVSQAQTVERMARDFPSKTPVDIVNLREFVRDTFDWTYRTGAVKLVRSLAPSLLVQSLLLASTDDSATSQNPEMEKGMESTLVKGVSSRRAHFSTDAMPELRVSYIPIDMVPLDLDAEPEEEVASFGRDGLALNSDDEFDEELPEVEDDSLTKKSKAKPFDPLAPNLLWVPEHIVQLGVPLTFEAWEEAQRLKELAKEAAAAAPKRGRKRAVKKPDMLPGALDKYVKVTKKAPGVTTKETARQPSQPHSPLADLLSSPRRSAPREFRLSSSPVKDTDPFPDLLSSPRRSKPTRKPRGQAAPKQPSSTSSTQTNPWMLAGSQISARITKMAGSSHPKPSTPTRKGLSSSSVHQEPILISSSPVVPASASFSPSRVNGTQPPSSDPSDLPSSPPVAPPSPAARRKPSQVPSSPVKRTTRARSKKLARQDTLPSLKQASIRDYGVGIRAPPSSSGKTPAATNSDPITFLSDDEEPAPAPAPSLPPYPSTTRKFGKSASFAASPGASDLPSYPRQFTKSSSFAAAPTPQKKTQLMPSSPEASDDGAFPHINDMFGVRQPEGGQQKSNKKRFYIPRTSAVGYFKTVEVEAASEEAERLSQERGVVEADAVPCIDLTEADYI